MPTLEIPIKRQYDHRTIGTMIRSPFRILIWKTSPKVKHSTSLDPLIICSTTFVIRWTWQPTSHNNSKQDISTCPFKCILCRLPLTNLELWFKRQSCYVGAFNPKIKISSHYLKRSPSKEPFVCYFVVGHLFLPKNVAAANGEKNSGVSEFLPFFSTFPCCILFSKVPICSSQFSRIYLESCLHPTPQTLWADCAWNSITMILESLRSTNQTTSFY